MILGAVNNAVQKMHLIANLCDEGEGTEGQGLGDDDDDDDDDDGDDDDDDDNVVIWTDKSVVVILRR